MRNLAALLPSFLAATSALACSTNPTATDVGGGGGGGSATGGPPAWNRVVTPPGDDEAAARRLACAYRAGSLPAETQGASYPGGAAIPIDHILVLVLENRSFDHYFSRLPESGQPDVDVAPSTYTNPDGRGGTVAPYHDTRRCLVDTNHEWAGSHLEYDSGAMDGFFLANEGTGTEPPHPLAGARSGARALAYYDRTDLPFYYWLAGEFAIADHYHSALLGPTWPNRMYLYAATSRGVTNSTLAAFRDQAGACTGDSACGGVAGACVNGSCKGTCRVDSDCGLDVPAGTCDVAGGGDCLPVGRTIFDSMEQRHLDWKVYSSGTPGWAVMLSTWLQYRAGHQRTFADYLKDAAAGTLPQVAFVDPTGLGDETYDGDDEHPPGLPQGGQAFSAAVVEALVKSPAWSSSALFLTYDEHGGFWDHVPPPAACEPDAIAPILAAGDPPGAFDRYGVRVPMMVVSPFARQHYVAHGVYDHTSILRFIEARFVLPALTGRDANALAPWEMFDFAAPPHAVPPAVPVPPDDQAALRACAEVWVP